MDARVAGPQAVDIKTLEDEIKSAHPPVLIDVREPFEREAGAIPGDTNIPMGALLDHLNDIPKDKPVVIYCRSGNRSARAVAMLQGKGYTNVKTLTGGMNAWSAHGGEKCPSC